MQEEEVDLKALQEQYDRESLQLEKSLLQCVPWTDIVVKQKSLTDLSLKIYRLLASANHPAGQNQRSRNK